MEIYNGHHLFYLLIRKEECFRFALQGIHYKGMAKKKSEENLVGHACPDIRVTSNSFILGRIAIYLKIEVFDDQCNISQCINLLKKNIGFLLEESGTKCAINILI